ncbi:hypothetical protein IMG5_149460 [Ichthyophthirius multifiliis]|uniref:Uncharacterized protein n=1 Tax=Ichthyophthirius multifiliis TaxID=5932 RepID=G0QYG7_ICHMU|nr:hypothetical protein IMG5_149460 [Ichthyophthirius multifiliis]EGR29738.1 hypothetical protein IMG5_149460 [Ichthyophthirius multifiliis]|eukprot:XP_004030974.1 hypothetical protein IMG5_149460 [Ichthyophthirius multifiliis]
MLIYKILKEVKNIKNIYQIFFIYFNDEYFSDCKYLKSQNFSNTGPEDIVQISDNVVIGGHAQLHMIFKGLKDIDEVQKGGFYQISGLKDKNLQIKKVEIIGFPEDVFLIPHGIYYDQNILYVINHAYYSGVSDRIEYFEVIKEDENTFKLKYQNFTQLPIKFNGISNDLVVFEGNKALITIWQPYTAPSKGQNQVKPDNISYNEKLDVFIIGAGVSGGILDWSGQYLILGSFIDNNVSVCQNKKNIFS